MQPHSSAVSHGKELYNTNSPSASPVTVIRIIWIHVLVPHVAAAAIRGWGLVKKYGTTTTMVFVRLLLLLQLLLSTKNLTSREVKAKNSLNLCLSKQIFRI